jgi:hypothetical protein
MAVVDYDATVRGLTRLLNVLEEDSEADPARPAPPVPEVPSGQDLRLLAPECAVRRFGWR